MNQKVNISTQCLDSFNNKVWEGDYKSADLQDGSELQKTILKRKPKRDIVTNWPDIIQFHRGKIHIIQ